MTIAAARIKRNFGRMWHSFGIGFLLHQHDQKVMRISKPKRVFHQQAFPSLPSSNDARDSDCY